MSVFSQPATSPFLELTQGSGPPGFEDADTDSLMSAGSASPCVCIQSANEVSTLISSLASRSKLCLQQVEESYARAQSLEWQGNAAQLFRDRLLSVEVVASHTAEAVEYTRAMAHSAGAL